MSTYRGIAVVTRTLQQLLSNASTVVAQTVVKLGPPEELKPGGGPVVNLFLFNARPTEYHRNLDLPGRDAAGTIVGRPVVGLELDYLISFTGDRNSYEPELLLGSCVAALEASSVLTPADVGAAVAGASNGLVPSDLAEAIEVYPLNLDIEERSKLWSVFFQVPYKLSVEYRARTVLIDAGPVPPSVRPVLVVNNHVESMATAARHG
jgi:hypothetical protein